MRISDVEDEINWLKEKIVELQAQLNDLESNTLDDTKVIIPFSDGGYDSMPISSVIEDLVRYLKINYNYGAKSFEKA